ncbi:unnamed protein product [Chrysodeixis includens]|uniref:DUF4781 domain-containing protein n=1 Tax=Chrysodeixis includens TaxID=689277 RepID=A0A9P0BPG0_CHRIL|nr:unnamed protein product [Chrysodeixis includens]
MAENNQIKAMSAIEIQQEYYEAIGDADWELYKREDRRYLLQKVAVALCGPPTKEGNLMDGVEEVNGQLQLQGYEKRDEETCLNVFNKILEQAKYSFNNQNLVISVLRVVCVIPSKDIPIWQITPKDYWLNLHTKKGESVHILVFHVFSIRKCISMKPEVKGCRIYIDHDGRVYESWMAYLTENKLPKCVMVVPRNGEYSGVIKEGDDIPHVQLSVLASPELGPKAAIINTADNLSTVANIGALVSIVGSVFAAPAVAPVMVTGAIGVGVVTGVYGIARSITNLVDRAQHDQNIGLDNSEARSSWINIMISSVGLSFATAGKLLSWAASSGRNVKILMSALDFLKFTNLATGIIGVANGLGDMIYNYVKYGETPTKTEVFQFTTSALFLGLGVMSNQTAQDIVQDAQANKINEIRDSLASNNKRKIFDKVTAETRRVKGTIEGNTEVIRALKKIENKDDFFGKLKRVNKSVNRNKVRISLSADGKVMVNNQHQVSVSKIYHMGEEGRNKLFAKYGPAKVTTKNAPTRIYSSRTVAGNSSVTAKELACSIRPEEIMKITAFLIHLSKADQDVIIELLSNISEVVHDGFLLVCAELIASLVPAEIKFIDSVFPDWKVRVVLFVFQYLKSKVRDDENDGTFMSMLKEYIREGRISREMILRLKKELINFFSDLKNSDAKRNMYSNVSDILRKNLMNFKILRSEQNLHLGPHVILIKQDTLDGFETRLAHFTQNKCDLFIQLCFAIISALSKGEVLKLRFINPDEDVVMKVSEFLLGKFEYYMKCYENINKDMIDLAKCDLIKWCDRQYVRRRYTCCKCSGITYYQK